jgi:undecaprenyl-diphosphatase
VLFAVVVHLRLLDRLDVAVRDASRPGGVWGPMQIRAAHLADALQPTHVVLAILLIVAGVSMFRHSLRPLVTALVVGLPVAVVTLVTKWVMAYSESRATPVAHGSFPSGHTVGVVIVFGLVVLLFRPGARWSWLLPVLLGCVMGSALILAGIHPVTDVIGAGLLSAAALCGACAAGLGQWSNGRPARSVG